jgi:hypothetical protein
VLVTDVYSLMAAQELSLAVPRLADGVVPAIPANPAGPHHVPDVVAAPLARAASREVVLVYPDGNFSIDDVAKLKAHAEALLGKLASDISSSFWKLAIPNAKRFLRIQQRKLACINLIDKHEYIRSFLPSQRQSVVSERAAQTADGKEILEKEKQNAFDFARKRSGLQISALELDLIAAGERFNFNYLWTEALRSSDQDLVGFGKLAETKQILEATVDNVFKEGDERHSRFSSHYLPAMRSLASILQHGYDQRIVNFHEQQRKAKEQKQKAAEKRDAADEGAQKDKNASVAAIAEQAAAGAAQEISRPLESRIAQLENALNEMHNSNLTLVAAVKHLKTQLPQQQQHHQPSITSPQRGTPNKGNNGMAPAPPSQSRPPPSPSTLKSHTPQPFVRPIDLGNAKPNASAKPREQSTDTPAAKAAVKRSTVSQQGEPSAQQLSVTTRPSTRGHQQRVRQRNDSQRQVTTNNSSSSSSSNTHSTRATTTQAETTRLTRSTTARGTNQHHSQSPRSGNAFASLAELGPSEMDQELGLDEELLDGIDPDTTIIINTPRARRRRGRGGWRGGSERDGSPF